MKPLRPLPTLLLRLLVRAAARVAAALCLAVLCSTAMSAEPEAPPAVAPKGFDARRENIERGKVETIEYDSKSVGGKRKMLIYTPPAYTKDSKVAVLYLLHGAGDDETGWVKKGSADVILDNLYADKKLAPMIVVMPNGFARPAAADPGERPRGNPFSFDTFANDLLDDVIPYVESHYSVVADRDHRALAGLSMGAAQSLSIGLKHLDRFAWIGAFSGANFRGSQSDLVPDLDAASKQLRLLWLSCGDADKLVGEHVKALHAYLEEKHVPHHYQVDSGGHEWRVWMNDLYLVSQLLFHDP